MSSQQLACFRLADLVWNCFSSWVKVLPNPFGKVLDLVTLERSVVVAVKAVELRPGLRDHIFDHFD